MPWFYLSFVKPLESGGATFLGACLVRAHSHRTALEASHRLGCNPGGEVAILEVEPEHGDPPANLHSRLFRTREELEVAFQPWLGAAGAKTETTRERRERGQPDHAAYVCSDHNEGD